MSHTPCGLCHDMGWIVEKQRHFCNAECKKLKSNHEKKTKEAKGLG